MTLSEPVLRRAAEWKPAGDPPQTLLVADEASGWALALAALKNDAVACVAWEVALRRAGGVPARELRGRAATVAGRLTLLLEPIVVVEVDASKDEALLRSREARRSDQALIYFEARVRGSSEVVLARYRGFPGGKPREQIGFPLTHEALARLAEELTA